MKALAVCLLIVALPARADAPPSLPGIREAMRNFVEKKEIAGAVTLVASHNKILHLGAEGQADIAAVTPMTPDRMFWIASMTKPITATAIMMLRDEGKLSIEDAVAKYLPEFAALEKSVTLRHCLTHTCGLSDKPADVNPKALAELVSLYPKRPLRFEPGSKWEYSNPGINTLGRIVEVVSGSSFEAFLRDRFFIPLAMTETTFHPDARQAKLLAKTYRKTTSGGLEETVISILLGGVQIPPPDSIPFPAGGLFSTAPDMARFYQMLLNGGEKDGRRYVSSESLKMMTSIQTGGLKTGFVDGMAWGLGWAVVKEPKGVTAMMSPGSFGHGGAYGTQAWLDPTRDRVFLLMIQRAGLANADASDIRRAFQELAAQGLK